MPDAEPLVQEVQFDISPALASLRDLDAAFEDTAANLQTALADAIASAVSGGVVIDDVDASPVSDAIVTAVDDGAATPVVVEDADATTVSDAIIAAVDEGAQEPAVIDGQAGDVTTAIDAAVADADTNVDVTADVSQAVDQIGTLENQEVQIDVVAPGVDDVAAQLDDLGNSAKSAGGGAHEAAGDFALLGVATRGAKGEVGALGTAAASLGPGFGVAAAAAATFAGFIGSTVELAVKADTALTRFNREFGSLAGQVDSIHIDGLNTDIKGLAVSLGSSATQMRTAAANVGQLGNSAGAAKGDIADTAQSVLLLASRAVALNPALGDAGQVAQNLTRALASGRDRALVPYGIALDKAAVAAQAQAEATKRGASEINVYDKIAAAAAVTTAQLGDTLGSDIQKGTQDAEIGFRRLGVEVRSTLVEVGKPLVAPALQIFEKLVPLAQELATVLGDLAQAVLPTLVPVVETLVVPLVALGKVIEAIPDPIKQDAAAFAVFALAVDAVAIALEGLGIVISTSVLAPIALAAGVIGVLALHFGLLKGSGGEAAAAVNEVGQAAFGTVGDLDGLISSVGKLDESLDSVVKNLAQGKLDFGGKAFGQSVADQFAQAGLSVIGTRTALQGTDAQFAKFISTLDGTRNAFQKQHDAASDLQSSLGLIRGNLEDAALSQVEFLGKTQAVTKEQQRSAIALNTAKDGTINYIGALKILTTQADLNVKSSSAVTAANLQQSKAWADLRTAILAGTDVNVDLFAQKVGLTTEQVQADVDALKKTIDDFVTSGVSALPTAADAFKSWSTGVEDAFKAVGDAASSGEGPKKVKAALDALVAAADPKALIDKLNAQIGQIVSFQANLQNLFAKGFTNVAAFLVKQGPVLGAALADSLVNNDANAAALNTTLGDLDTATQNYAQFLRTTGASNVVGGATALGEATSAGFASGLDLATPSKVATDTAITAVQAASPGLSREAAAAAVQADLKFEQGLGLPDTATKKMTQAGDAIITHAPTSEASTAGSDTAGAFQTAFNPAARTQIEFGKVGPAISGTTATLKGLSSSAGADLGNALSAGVASGVTVSAPLIGKALTDAIAVAHARARRLIEASSPSKLFARDIGVPMGEGIAVGIASQEAQVVAAAEQIVQAAANAVRNQTLALPVVASRSGSLASGTSAPGATVGKVEFNTQVTVNGQLTADQAATVGQQIGDSAARQLQKSGILAAVRANGSGG